jgi:hypothetical protein
VTGALNVHVDVSRLRTEGLAKNVVGQTRDGVKAELRKVQALQPVRSLSLETEKQESEAVALLTSDFLLPSATRVQVQL